MRHVFWGRALWVLVSIGAAVALATIAQTRGEPVNSMWLIVASVCTYLLGYRFYAAFVGARVMALDNRRATPAERLRDEPRDQHELRLLPGRL